MESISLLNFRHQPKPAWKPCHRILASLWKLFLKKPYNGKMKVRKNELSLVEKTVRNVVPTFIFLKPEWNIRLRQKPEFHYDDRLQEEISRVKVEVER